MRLVTLLLLATSLTPGSGEQKCGLVPTKVFLSKGEKRQLVFWTDQDYSMAVAPVESSQATTTENSTLPAVEASEEEEVDTFLQAVNGQLPGFGGSKESEESPTELEEETTEAANADDKHKMFYKQKTSHQMCGQTLMLKSSQQKMSTRLQIQQPSMTKSWK
jgi:hypothetical protein